MTIRSAVSRPAEAGTRTLSPGDVVEIAVTDLLANGQGVGRASGLVVFVWGPLPGERARTRITLVKAKYAVGELIELLDRSPDRTLAFCSVFGECGGCQVQHLAYRAQLEWKRTMIVSALQRIGGISGARIEAPIGMIEPRRYRNKMALVVRSNATGAQFGFYQARSHDMVPIEECPVVQPRLDLLIGQLWSAARRPETSSAFAGARHVVARTAVATKETVVSVTTDRPSTTLAALAPALLHGMPGVVGIANSYDPGGPNAVMGRRNITLAGRPDIEEQIGDVRFRVSAASFFQVNSEMVARIFEVLRPALGDAHRVVDLYCGAGTFSLFFARHGARVAGIEENHSAVREALANADRNGLAGSVSFIAGRVERLLQSGPSAKAVGSANVVFLDPPRKGSDELTLRAIAAARVPHVWYLSCNPATLARDLALLVGSGYVLDLVQPFDMFPQTGHIEALAVLRRSGTAPAPFGG